MKSKIYIVTHMTLLYLDSAYENTLNIILKLFVYNVLLVSDIQQSDSVIYRYTYISFQILFHYRLL